MSDGSARPGGSPDGGGAPLEELLRHRDFVRRLARRLVRDEARAEDVVQDTYVAALRNPPRHAGALRAWLASVVRKIAFTHRRSEQRRRDREQNAAPARALPSPGDVADRAQWHQRVVNAVMELDDPYRTTLLLRYFEDLNSSEIARAQGVPAATVRTRIKRGLEQLREQLDRRVGGDRAAWMHGLLLLGWRPDELAAATRAARRPDPAPLLPVAAAAAGILAVLGVVFFWRAGGDAAGPTPRAPLPRRTAAGPAGVFLHAPPAAGEPLAVTVLGAGRPVSGATVVVARRRGHPWRFSSRDRWVEWDRGRADDAGVARFDTVPDGFVRVFAAAPGFAAGAATVSRPVAFTYPVVVELPPGRAVPFEVRDAATGAPVPDATVRLDGRVPEASAVTASDGAGVLGGAPRDGRADLVATADGYAGSRRRTAPATGAVLFRLAPRHRTVRWPVRHGPPEGATLVVRLPTEASGRAGRIEDGAVVAAGFGAGVLPELVAIAADGLAARLVAPGEPTSFARPPRLAVRVRDPGGPVAGIEVQVVNAAGHPLPPGATTGPDGRAALPVYAADPVEVRIRDGRHAVFRAAGRFDPRGGSATIEVALAPGRDVLLRVRGGLPPGTEVLAGRTLVAASRTRSGAHRFRVRGREPVAVHVLAPGFLPATAIVDPAGAGPARVAVDLEPGCALEARVVLRAPHQPYRLDLVPAEAAEDGDAPPLRRGPWQFRLYVGPDGVVRETMLPPGLYRVRDRVTGVVSRAFRAARGRPARVRLDLSRDWPLVPRGVRGRVAGGFGLDLAAAAVVVEGAGGARAAVPVAADGSFAFPWKDGGPLRVAARHPYAARGRTVTLTGPRDDLVLELEPHRARLRLDPRPEPLAGHETAPRVRVAADGRVRTFDAALEDGVLAFAGFRPARADLWIDVAGFAPARLRGVELRPGETDLGTLRLRRGARLRLRVLGRAGEPRPSLIVSAQGEGYQRSLHTGGAGTATLAGLGEGRFRVTAWESPGGFRVFRTTVESNGTSAYDVEIDLR